MRTPTGRIGGKPVGYFTIVAEDLNSGFPRTNPASDKGRDSNSGPLKYTSRSLTAWPRCLEDMMHLAGCGHFFILFRLFVFLFSSVLLFSKQVYSRVY